MNSASDSVVRKIKAGVLVNFAGGLSLGGLKLFTMAMPAVFGIESYAAYAVVYGLVEILSWGVFNGYGDACIYFQSRGGEDANAKLAAGLRQPVLLTAVVALILWFLAPVLHSLLWPGLDPVLVDLLQLAMPSLPALALTYCMVESTRAKLDMRWAVICIQFLFPALVLVVGLILHFGFGMGILSMGWGLLLSPWLCLPVAFWGFSRHYSLRAVWKELRHFRKDREVASFALPQSVSMFVNQGLPRMDILLLSLWSGPTVVAIYGVIAELLLVIRLPKSILFGVFAPLVADLGNRQETHKMQKVFDHFIRLSASLSFILLIVTYVFRDHVLLLQGFAPGVDLSWSPILAMSHLLVGALGLNGSLLLMHGHSKIMMKIALLSIAVELILGVSLVPSFGPWGAAIALGASTVLLIMVQIVQVVQKLSLDPMRSGSRFWIFAGILWMCFVEWMDHGMGDVFIRHMAQLGSGAIALILTSLFIRYWRGRSHKEFSRERILVWWRDHPRI